VPLWWLCTGNNRLSASANSFDEPTVKIHATELQEIAQVDILIDDGECAAIGLQSRIVPVQNRGHFFHGGRVTARSHDAAGTL